MSPIYVVSSSFPRWPDDSAGRFVAASVSALRQHGLDCQVIAPCDPLTRPQPFVQCFHYASSSEKKLCYGQGIMPKLRAQPTLFWQVPSLVLRMAQAIRRQAAEQVIAHWLLPAGFSAILAGVKNLVVIVHGSDLALLEQMPFGADLARFFAAHTRALIFVSEDLRQRFYKLSGLATGEVLPPTTFAPAGTSRAQALRMLKINRTTAPVLLFVGRFVAGKGIDNLLNSLQLLSSSAELWLVGDGPLLPKMSALARRLHLEERLRFWGHLNPRQLSLLYAAADVFVMPSQPREDGHAEGFPTVLIEAMAAGLAIVATRVGGVPEHLRDGQNALLCPAANPQKLAQAIVRLAQNPPLAQALSQQAKDDVQALLPTAHGRRLRDMLVKYWGADFRGDF